MNSKPELEQLFEAARRHQADLKRQEHLGQMIDRLAAAERPRRRPLWVYVGIAASVLLLFSVGLRLLYNDGAVQQPGPLVAEVPPVYAPAADSISTVDTVLCIPATVYRVPRSAAPDTQAEVLLADAGPENVETENGETETENGERRTENIETENGERRTDSVGTESGEQTVVRPRVFERTSTQLVCGGGCTPQRQPNAASSGDAPLLTLNNNAGTSVDFKVGTVSF